MSNTFKDIPPEISKGLAVGDKIKLSDRDGITTIGRVFMASMYNTNDTSKVIISHWHSQNKQSGLFGIDDMFHLNGVTNIEECTGYKLLTVTFQKSLCV